MKRTGVRLCAKELAGWLTGWLAGWPQARLNHDHDDHDDEILKLLQPLANLFFVATRAPQQLSVAAASAAARPNESSSLLVD